MSPSVLGCFHGLKFICELLLILSLSPLSTAAPIRETSPSSTWLALMTALLVFSILLLSTFKLFFVRYRKANNLRGPPPAFVKGQYVHPSFRLFKFRTYTACTENCRAGFLVGLFGSPSFEIYSKPSEIALVYPGAEGSQKINLCSDTSASYKTKDSTISAGPVILFDDEPVWRTRGRLAARRMLSPSSLKATRSTLLIPSELLFDLGRIQKQQPPSDIPLSNNEKNLSWPHSHLDSTTLRMINFYAETETCLPDYGDVEGSEHISPVQMAHKPSVAHSDGNYSLPLSPLPPLPVSPSGREQQIENFYPGPSITYPLNSSFLGLVKPGRQNCRRASLSPKLSIIEEVCSLPEFLSTSKLDLNSYAAEFPSDQTKPLPALPTGEAASKASIAYETLKRKERSKTSLRNRRSPPLGPSPLRSMILPDIAEVETPHTSMDEINDLPALSRHSITSRHLGLGLPSLKLSHPEERIVSRDSDGGASHNRESMFDFLRELAEETQDWDDSIALNEGFRYMIQRSQTLFNLENPDADVQVKFSTPKARESSPDDGSPERISFWTGDSSPSL